MAFGVDFGTTELLRSLVGSGWDGPLAQGASRPQGAV